MSDAIDRYRACVILGAGAAWGDVPSWISVGVVALGVPIAIWQLVEGRALRREQLRPYVYVDVEPNAVTPTFLDIVVRNGGQTGAYEVQFAFEPPLVSALDDHAGCPDHRVIADQLGFSAGIETLPPGKELRTVFEENAKRKASDLPLSHKVTIRYRGARRGWCGRRSWWTDVYYLDLQMYGDVHYLERSRPTDELA